MEINQILKLKEIDQLDSAILQFSKNTLATKKICASLLIGIIAIILRITNNSLDDSIYISSFFTFLLFWVIDSNSYYYQRKLRIRMSKLVKELEDNASLLNGFGMPLEQNETSSWIKAFFNESQLFYIIGIVVVVVLFIFHKMNLY